MPNAKSGCEPSAALCFNSPKHTDTLHRSVYLFSKLLLGMYVQQGDSWTKTELNTALVPLYVYLLVLFLFTSMTVFILKHFTIPYNVFLPAIV